MTTNEMKNQKSRVTAKVLALESPEKRIKMLAALKTAFVVLSVLYLVIAFVWMVYLGAFFMKANKEMKTLNTSIISLQEENASLKKALKESNEALVNISNNLAIKEKELTKAQQQISSRHNRIPIHKVETVSTEYNFKPYYYAMQATKYNKYFISEKDMSTILEWSNKYNLDPNLVIGVMWVESRFYPKAKSRTSSASGYGQFIRATGEWTHNYLLKRKEKYDHTVHPFNPDYSIPMICAYLNHLVKITKGDVKKVLIRYNGNELGKKYYELIDDYFSKVTSDVSLNSIETNIKNKL